jgi:hypothetical protein
MSTIEITVLVLIGIAIFTYQIGATAWVACDAPRRGISNGMPAALTFLMGPFGLLMWLAMRPPLQSEKRDDATASAALGPMIRQSSTPFTPETRR